MKDNVRAARNKLESAREGCAHWDYESDGEGHDCCHAVAKAEHEYRRARRETGRGLEQRPV